MTRKDQQLPFPADHCIANRCHQECVETETTIHDVRKHQTHFIHNPPLPNYIDHLQTNALMAELYHLPHAHAPQWYPYNGGVYEATGGKSSFDLPSPELKHGMNH